MTTLILSDTHLGFKYCRAKDLAYILLKQNINKLILVGDILDLQQMNTRPYWDHWHQKCINIINNLIDNGVEVIYVVGNHEEDSGESYKENIKSYFDGSITILGSYTYTSGDKQIHCVHGHQYEDISPRMRRIGDFLYNLCLCINSSINKLRMALMLSPWCFSKWVKDKVKDRISKEFSIEEKLLTKNNSDIIIYGHTHQPYIKSFCVKGKNKQLANTGAFVEIATYITEEDGVLTLYNVDDTVERI